MTNKQGTKQYKLYNEELKMNFMSDSYAESTQKQVIRILSNAYDIETELEKDLCNFNFKELEDFLVGLNRKSVQSLYSIVSYLRRYTDYAIEKGYSATRINYLNLFRGTEMLEKYVHFIAENIVDTEKTEDNQFNLGKYITREELHRVMDFCYNAQDGALFGIMFEGAYGVALEEVGRLKPTDCNIETGEVILTRTDKGTGKLAKRTIQIDDRRVLDTLDDAINQRVYDKNNGLNEDLLTPRFDLSNSDYVFKISGRNDNSPIKPMNINNRIRKIALLYDNPFLNPVNIWISGQIDYGKRLMEKLNLTELETKHYEIINDRFGYDRDYWYNTKRRIVSYLEG